jgi:hypothetical protein
MGLLTFSINVTLDSIGTNGRQAWRVGGVRVIRRGRSRESQ